MASPVSQLELDQCAAEPIHIPGAIQPHGLMFCVDTEGVVTHVSANSEQLFNRPLSQILGMPIAGLLSPKDAKAVRKLAQAASSADPRRGPGPSTTLKIGDKRLRFQAHIGPQAISIFEVEPYEPIDTIALFEKVQGILMRLHACDELHHLCKEVTVEVQRLLRFERVTLYRFDDHWNGWVVAETKTGDLPSYQDLHFPASDIPAQARALYHLNSLRLTPDAAYEPVPLLAASQAEQSLDMSHCVLRSISPIHREYLANMGVRASMSLSLFRRGRLWGLVSCSQSTPHYVPHNVRGAASLVGEFVSALVESKEDTADASYYLRLKNVQTALLQRMRQGNDIIGGLTGQSPSVLDATCAQGAAIIFGNDIHLVGDTPSKAQVQALRAWVAEQPESGFWHTNTLPTLYPPAMEYRDKGCGVLALPLTNAQNNWLFWFRPEVAQTVKWGGDPRKPTQLSKTGRLEPRKSFELWKETVHLKALPWQESELLSAKDLKNSVIDVLLQSSEELASLNQELERSNVELDAFAYAASHDLKEPLRGIHNYTALAQRELQQREGLKETQKRLQTVMLLTLRMEDLINALLHYAQVGRVELDVNDVPMDDLVRSCCEEMRTRLDESHVEVKILDLPVVKGHAVLLREVVVNLVTNAIKYNESAAPQVTVGRRSSDGALFVSDNGIGIKEKNLGTIFKIFRRLHGRDKFGGGTGTGLTIAKRIVERHGGSIWVESTYGHGSTFYFTLGGNSKARESLPL